MAREFATPFHVPVLVHAVAQLAVGRRRMVDCTVGGGGHAARLLEDAEALLAIDRDPAAIAAARSRLPDPRVEWRCGSFAAEEILTTIGRFQPDFVLFDLGVSSRQVDANERGFSFRRGVLLDMRMASGAERSAADLLNEESEAALARIFAEHGDEPRAKSLAATIVRRRARARFRISDDLVGAIRHVLGPRAGPPDFARLFQAVRIAVNHELDELERALPRVLAALVPSGRIAVISYHSGEDRIVKRLFREWSRACVCPSGFPVCQCRGRPLGTVGPRRPLRPNDDEIAVNPRARSAKLRGFTRADPG